MPLRNLPFQRCWLSAIQFNLNSCSEFAPISPTLDAQLAAQNLCQRLGRRGRVVRRAARSRASVRTRNLSIALLQQTGVLLQPGHFYNFPGEGYLVASLITPTDEFAEGIAAGAAVHGLPDDRPISYRMRQPSLCGNCPAAPKMPILGMAGGIISSTVLKYSIVVPFHNEEQNVTELYDRLKAVMETTQEPFELVFVDDGSKDHTFSLLQQIAAVDRRVVVVKLRRNFGQTSALPLGSTTARPSTSWPWMATCSTIPTTFHCFSSSYGLAMTSSADGARNASITS